MKTLKILPINTIKQYNERVLMELNMEPKPRYSRTSDIIDLLILMQSKFNGVTLAEIQKRFGVSRRTAERMRDSLMNILPSVQELESDGRTKRWGFINYSMADIISFSNKDIAILKNLKNRLDEQSINDLSGIIDKMQALTTRKSKIDIEKEVEYLMHIEGSAVKQSPKYKLNLENVQKIRNAIKEHLKLKAKYNDKEKLLLPLGLIFSNKVYLVAIEENKGDNPYHYLLHKFNDVEVTSEKFEKEDFNLQEFANQSFGIYQGESYSVKLEFDKSCANDVLNFNFHPTQKIQEQQDGSVLVEFKASGEKEIMWHIFTWGDKVKIIEPKALRLKYVELLESCTKAQNS